jgi:DNA-binding MarR family transcriptional regulator
MERLRQKAKMTDDRLALERFLPYRLNRLAEAVSRDFSRIYKERFGLTRPEWRLLATLGQYGTMTATEVGAHSAMHKTKVSRAVTALEQRRWLIRKSDTADRRVERLSLTAAGEDAYRQLVPLAREFENGLLERLSSTDRNAALAGLDALESLIAGGNAT